MPRFDLYRASRRRSQKALVPEAGGHRLLVGYRHLSFLVKPARSVQSLVAEKWEYQLKKRPGTRKSGHKLM